MELIKLLDNLLNSYGDVLPKEDIDAIKYIKGIGKIEDWSNNKVQNFIKKTLLSILSKKYVTPSEMEYPLNFIVNVSEHMTYIKALEIIHAYAEVGIYLSENCYNNLLVSVFNKTLWLSKINDDQRNIILQLIMEESNPKQVTKLESFITQIENTTTKKYIEYLYKYIGSKLKYSIAKKDINGIINSFIEYYNYKLSILCGNNQNFETTKKVIMDYFDNNFQCDLRLQFDYFHCEKEYSEFKEEYEQEKKLLFEHKE